MQVSLLFTLAVDPRKRQLKGLEFAPHFDHTKATGLCHFQKSHFFVFFGGGPELAGSAFPFLGAFAFSVSFCSSLAGVAFALTFAEALVFATGLMFLSCKARCWAVGFRVQKGSSQYINSKKS